MPINIENLSLDELFDLNKRIIHRVRYLQSLKTRAALEKFELGDRVAFQSDGRTIEGIVIRVNQKTLSVKTKDARWNLSPRFVTKLSPAGAAGLKTIEEILNDGAQ